MAPRRNQSALNQRRRIQKEDRNLVRTCPFCERTFKKNEHAIRHIRSHTNERPFKCSQCGKTYPRGDTLRRHERGHHPLPAVDIGSFENNSETTVLHSVENATPMLPDSTSTNINQRPQASAANGALYSDASLDAVGFLSGYQQPDIAHSHMQSYAHTNTVGSIDQPDLNHSHLHNDIQPQEHMPVPVHGPLYFGMDLDAFSNTGFSNNDWLLSSDFDIGAVDTALNETLFEWAQTLPMNMTDLQASQHTTLHSDLPNIPLQRDIATTSTTLNSIAEPDYTDRWYARIQREEGPIGAARLMSRAASEDEEDEVRVDEQFTASLSNHLRPRQYEETRLSVSYLNECLRLYFTRFHPIFPVIHFPSFRPNSRNALLFLSMCSIGSLFIGGSSAVSQGYHIYTRLNKAMLASWETYLSGTPQRSLSMIQSALTGQTFGLLSGRSNNVAMTDMFQGTMMTWARKLGCYQRARNPLPTCPIEPAERSEAWKKWYHEEQLQRFLLALYIHDTETSSLLHHEPLMRHMTFKHNSLLSDPLFEAPTAEKWYALLNHRQHLERPTMGIPRLKDWLASPSLSINNQITTAMQDSQLVSYAILENLNAGIIESRQAGELTAEQQQKFTNGLITWSKSFRHVVINDRKDILALRLLWHSSFMTLTTDFNILERSLGRFGHAEANGCIEQLDTWARSLDALRCLLHASALQMVVEDMRMNWTPAIHVPRVLFHAGIAWVCHQNWHKLQDRAFEFGGRTNIETVLLGLPEVRGNVWFNETHVVGIMSLISNRARAHYQGTIYGIIELLQRLDRWTISTSFACILRDASSKAFHD